MASPLIQLIPIEKTLHNLWNALQIGSKTRACLYNIIVYHKTLKNPRHTQEILNAVSSKFPSRIFLISNEENSETPYLKIDASLKSHSQEVICEQIDIDVSGHPIERVPFILLPHLKTDLPVYLFWIDDKFDAILDPLAKIANQVFLNSSPDTDLADFAQKTLSLLERYPTEITDLNWVNLRPWRKCFANVFHFEPRMKELMCSREIEIYYNNPVQACYLQTWISHTLGWSYIGEDMYTVNYRNVRISLIPDPSCSVSKVIVKTENNTHFKMTLLENEHQILVEISSPLQCEAPYKIPVLNLHELETLKEEILQRRPNTHYYGVLKTLQTRKEYHGSLVY